MFEKKFGSIKNNLSEAYSSVVSKKNDIKNVLSDSVDTVSSTVNVLSEKITEGVDSITSTVEVINEKVSNTVTFFVKFGTFMLNIGITIVAITAPVPTVIGLYLILLITEYIVDVGNDIDNTKENKKIDRAIKALKEYGVIPKNAIVKTDLINMNINSETGNITGTILKGTFKNKKIEEIDNNGIEEIIDSVSDEQIKDLLVAYLKFRIKKEN